MPVPNPTPVARSSLLAMVLDERRFAKAVGSSAHALSLDLEDAVTPADKAVARARVVELVRQGRGVVGGRELVVRINDLFTPWGPEDLEAIVDLDVDVIVYPRVRGAEEVWAVRRKLDERGSRASIRLILETSQAFMNLNDIMRVPGIGSIIHGAGDLTLETGIAVNERSALDVTATLTILAARAYGASVTDGIHLDEWRDPEAVRAYVRRAKRQGFDGLNSFYEPHMALINEVYAATPEEIAQARKIVDAYEAAQAQGLPATVVDGKAILIHHYARAVNLLADELARERAGQRRLAS